MESNKVFSLLYRGLTSRMENGSGQIPTNGTPADGSKNRLRSSMRSMSIDTRSVLSRDNENRGPDSSPTGQSCVVCQAEINFILPPTVSKEWRCKVKEFFCKHFPVAQFVPRGAIDFPFCFSCAKQLDKLINIEAEAEMLALKFKSLKDGMVSRSAEAYLNRVKSEGSFSEMGRGNFRGGGISRLDSVESLVFSHSDSKSISSLSVSDHSVFGSELRR